MPVWAVIQKESKILFLQRSEKTSRPGQWCLPGGGIQFGESPIQACKRAVKEATGMEIRLESKITYQQEHTFFMARLLEPEQSLTLQTSECADYAWVGAEDFLSLGKIMDLKRVKLILQRIGFL